MDWRDLRVVLAVGQHGSLARAGQALGIDPTTVSRRVTALEEELDAVLFRRTPRRWRPTTAGETVLARCDRMAREVRDLQHDVDRARGNAHGRVRITAVDEVFVTRLVPALGALYADHPKLAIELFATNQLLDLERGQADVALRLERPQVAGLVARRLADLDLVVAGTPEIVSLPPAERPVVLIGLLDTKGPENTALRALGGRVVLAATSLTVSIAAVRAGLGLGILPASEAGEALVVVERDVPSRPLWRAVPEPLVDAPRIRAVTEWLDDVFA